MEATWRLNQSERRKPDREAGPKASRPRRLFSGAERAGCGTVSLKAPVAVAGVPRPSDSSRPRPAGARGRLPRAANILEHVCGLIRCMQREQPPRCLPAAARAASPTGFPPGVLVPKRRRTGGEIGRASCRERV